MSHGCIQLELLTLCNSFFKIEYFFRHFKSLYQDFSGQAHEMLLFESTIIIKD